MNIAIIGAGVSGLISAIELGKFSNNHIDIYEKNFKCARKLAASGNGRCNITNKNVDKDKYNNPNFVSKIILSYDEMKKYLNNLGILLTNPDEDGRVYPVSYNSSSVIDCLLDNINQSNTNFIYSTTIDKIIFKNNKYIINKKTYDDVIISIGSTADEKYEHNPLEKSIISLGHKFTKCIPSLSSLKVKENLTLIDGVRTKAKVKMNIDGNCYEDSGEVIFKKDEISGIVIFELSHVLSNIIKQKKIKDVILHLDLLPEENYDYYYHNFIDEKYKKTKNDIKTLDGVFVKKLSKFIINKANEFDKGQKNNNVQIRITSRSAILNNIIHDFRLTVDPFKKPSVYQVINGGVDLNGIQPYLMSKTKKNLYFGGEILDINGDCGGYNIHFAISCGIKIAKSIMHKK